MLPPAYMTEEVLFPLHHCLCDVDVCARSFYDLNSWFFAVT